jgi:hypothetical protein
MANMSYCRFGNTLRDLRDCYDALGEGGVGDDETRARDSLLLVCSEIAEEFANEIEEVLEKRRAILAGTGPL